MKKIRSIVIAVSLFALIYQLLPIIGADEKLILYCFILSPFLMVWMVYRILKHGTPSEKTWDNFFYEDRKYHRNGKEEQTAA